MARERGPAFRRARRFRGLAALLHRRVGKDLLNLRIEAHAFGADNCDERLAMCADRVEEPLHTALDALSSGPSAEAPSKQAGQQHHRRTTSSTGRASCRSSGSAGRELRPLVSMSVVETRGVGPIAEELDGTFEDLLTPAYRVRGDATSATRPGGSFLDPDPQSIQGRNAGRSLLTSRRSRAGRRCRNDTTPSTESGLALQLAISLLSTRRRSGDSSGLKAVDHLTHHRDRDRCGCTGSVQAASA